MSDGLESGCCCKQAAESDALVCGKTPGGKSSNVADRNEPWIAGWMSTSAGDVPKVSTSLRLLDHLGTWKARWGIGRMSYSIAPGLYAVGTPTDESPVLVTANYKMSFDCLRAESDGIDAWILVLDTKGINVWCAAGKGTFGTDEIVHRVAVTKLADVVSHRRLIVPQLGAPGVAAHEVKQRCGFRVVYGPVRAADLPEFLQAGLKATPQMRRVRFSIWDRLAVAPVELMLAGKSMLLIAACFLLLAGLGTDGFDWARVVSVGIGSAALFLAACVASIVLAPALLPWLPGRAFAAKGAWLGLAFTLGLAGYAWNQLDVIDSWFAAAAWCLMMPAVASFLAMNYTGASTYTSLSGVRAEVRVAAPIQAICAIVGAVLWLVGRFV